MNPNDVNPIDECSNHCGPLYQRDGKWWCLNNYCENSYFFAREPVQKPEITSKLGILNLYGLSGYEGTYDFGISGADVALALREFADDLDSNNILLNGVQAGTETARDNYTFSTLVIQFIDKRLKQDRLASEKRKVNAEL